MMVECPGFLLRFTADNIGLAEHLYVTVVILTRKALDLCCDLTG